MNDVKGIAAMGAFVEHSLCMFLEGSKFKIADGEELRKHIEAAGVEQTVLCSDLGQVGIFGPIEGFRRGIKLCIDLGYDDAQIRKMVSSNAARMIGIEADLPTK
jgi:microsomal dipeptidase-like Zn-dependent dipeptidase